MKVRIRKLQLDLSAWMGVCPSCFRGWLDDTHAEALDRALEHIRSHHPRVLTGGAA